MATLVCPSSRRKEPTGPVSTKVTNCLILLPNQVLRMYQTDYMTKNKTTKTKKSKTEKRIKQSDQQARDTVEESFPSKEDWRREVIV